ncbi:MAG: class I adenylate-forming enzyme family protein [Candidatus Omnitrophica bacterium]|nr:class I adenylate-forming enzyme family protein [Candidatus Omnitrophota bacterium]
METEEKYLEKPWLKSQAMGCIPETFKPYREDITYTWDMLDKNVEKYPNELALVCFDYEITWKGLKEHVDRLATALSDLGVKKGDVVATVLPSSIQFVICDLAIPEIGAIHCPGNILDSVDGLIDKFTRAGIKTVICVDKSSTGIEALKNIRAVKEKTELKNIIATKERDYSKNPPAHEEEEGVIWLTDLIEKYPPNPPKVDIDPKKDLCLLFFTGGSTGIPKGVMLTHYQITACTKLTFGSMMPQSVLRLIDGFFTTIIPLPLCHLYGQEIYRYIMALGCTILLQTDPRDVEEYVRLAKKCHPLFTTMSPTQYGRMAKEDVGDLGILGLSGSMALAPKTQEGFEKKTKSVLIEAYGLSETSGATLTPTAMDICAPLLGGRETASKVFHLLGKILDMPGLTPLLRMGMGLIGRRNIGAIVNKSMPLISSIMPSALDSKRELTTSVGYPLVDEDFKVVNEDTGETIPIPKLVKEGLRGEMCVKGPHLMLGYWPNPGDGLDDEGYIHTGDVVKMDEAGRVYIVDRTKDMAIVSGYKVYTIELDDLLYEYPGVYEAAAIGVPDPDRPGSERIKVFIAPHPEYRGKIKEEDIIEYLKERVEKWAVPKSVEIRDELPKSPVEKIFKKQLREEEIEKMKKAGVLK